MIGDRWYLYALFEPDGIMPLGDREIEKKVEDADAEPQYPASQPR